MKTMSARQRPFQIKKTDKLPRVAEAEIQANEAQVLANADQGIQTAVVSANGKIRAVIGLNGFRYLPDPDPDPLEEIMNAVLDAAREQRK